MSNGPGLAVLLAVVVLVSATGVVGALGGDGPAQVDVETDSTTLNVDVSEDGTAAWEIVYRVELDDDNTTQAFDDLAADVEADSATYLDPFRDRMERTAAAAGNATGREMAVRNVAVETRRESQPQVEYGLLVYRFEWTNFATTGEGTVEAGDAIDRFFLDSETTLRLTAPEGYSAVSVTPEPTRAGDGEVVWEGQRDFDSGEPRVAFSRTTPTAASGAGGDSGDTGGSDGETGDGGLPVAAVLVLGALLAVGVWAYVRREGEPAPDETAAAGGAGDDDTGSTAAEGTDNAGPPTELLSNEERVLRLLEDNGGRLKQKQVADDLDWTAAKTSQVVSDLRDEDEVESFRLGRENVLTLPDVELESSGDE
jgi:hypothetical protein